MVAKSIDVSLSSLDRRPMLAAILLYWIALGLAASILAFAIRQAAGGYPPPLALAPTVLSTTAARAA